MSTQTIAMTQVDWKFRIVQWLAFITCRLLLATWRVQLVGVENRRKATSMHPKASVLYASFHENALTATLVHHGQGIACLVSHSKDGELVDFICKRIGLRTVRGSSSRGGKEARDMIQQSIQEGISVAFTVDGPRGPRRVCKPGIIDVAKKTGASIVPISVAGDRMFILKKTWDQTRIPMPFAKVAISYGEPIWIPAGTDGDEFLRRQKTLQEILESSDAVLAKVFTGSFL